jgi:NAD(P)-dependent dehydrogenase (short-subunit alcohol dehydrogenase family)
MRTVDDMSSIAGFSALVTGGGSGIGLGAAKALAADGAHVTICGRTESRLVSAALELEAAAAPNTRVQWVAADVTVEDDVRAAVGHATERSGSLDVVFACAGGSLHMAPITSSESNDFRATVELNVMGTFHTLKHAAPLMARSGGGSVIAMSSIAGTRTHRYLGAYCVGKAGIDTLVRVAADELGPSNIRVNAVQPGLVETEMVAGITAGGEVLEDYLAQMPLARVGTVEDVARLVRFLAGPESAWITGQSIAVDGGHHLRRGPDYTPFAEPVYGPDALRGLR